MPWLIEADRRLGSSHAEQSLPCQDNICHLSKGNWHSICISDGAGSSKFSEISSKFVAERFSQSLLLLADLIEVRGPGSWINDHIIYDVLELRKGLKAHTASSELDDYHCTLVSILLGKDVAIAVHIGDGAIVAGQCEDTSDSVVSVNGTLVASLPENGQYKNETFFITEPHWLKHLRIKVLGKVDWFVMGSDGGIEVLSSRQKLDGPLVADLINYIAYSSNQGDAVSQLIGSDFAAGKTTDDISLAIGWNGSESSSTNFVWNESMSKSLYLDPAVDARNIQAIPIIGYPTTSPLPSARLGPSRFSVILNSYRNKSALRIFVIFLLPIVLILCVYFFSTAQNVSVVSRENVIASSPQVEDPELPDSDRERDGDSDIDRSSGSGLNEEPVESEPGSNDDSSTSVPQDTLELEEDPSSSIFNRMMKIWSSIFDREHTEDPLIDQMVPRAVEPIEL